MIGRKTPPIKIKVCHKIRYCSYNQCYVKACQTCKIDRPVTEYHKSRRSMWGTGLNPSCKRCESARSAARRKKKGYRAYHAAYNAAYWRANRARKLARARELFKENRDRIYIKKKLEHIARIERTGASDFIRRYRTPRGKLAEMSKIIRRLGVKANSADCVNHWIEDRKYLRMFAAWKKSGFDKKLSPVPVAISKKIKPTTLKDFKFITYTQRMSEVAYERYEKYPEERAIRAAQLRSAWSEHCQRRRAGMCATKNNVQLAGVGVPVEAGSGALQRACSSHPAPRKGEASKGAKKD